MPGQNEQASSETPRREIEQELFSWQAPARPFKRRDRNFNITVLAIASVVSLILFLAEGIMPVFLLASLMFLYYVLNTVEPQLITYKITTWGIRIAASIVIWPQILRYWFVPSNNQELLVLQTTGITGRLELVINKQDMEKIREILKNYLAEEALPPNIFDKTTAWVSRKLPGNNPV